MLLHRAVQLGDRDSACVGELNQGWTVVEVLLSDSSVGALFAGNHSFDQLEEDFMALSIELPLLCRDRKSRESRFRARLYQSKFRLVCI